MKVSLAALAVSMMLFSVTALSAPNEFEGEVAKELEKAGKGLVDKISKIIGARIAELEKQIEARDVEIAELKKKLGERGKKAKAAPLSNAFLGVLHSAQDDGALVDGVVPGGPAAKSGIHKGDVLLAIGDRKVIGADLRAVVGGFKVGDTVKVALRRGTESKSIDVTLVERKAFLETTTPTREKGLLGVLVGEEPGVGLWIEKVEDGLTGAAVGLKVGDLLRRVNGRELKVLEDLGEVLDSALQGDNLTLDLSRKNVEITKVVELGGKKVAGRLIEEKGGEPASPAVAKASDAKPAHFGIEMEQGEGNVYVVNVTTDSTASAYGFAVLDIVQQVNGKGIKTLEDLGAVLGSRLAGDEIDVLVVRDGQEILVNAIKLAAKDQKVTAVSSALTEAAKAVAFKLKPAYLGIVAEQTGEGRVVIGDLANEPANKSSLEKGDEIIKFQGGEIKSIEDLEKALAELHAGDEATIVVMRSGAEEIIKIRLGARPE